jgi:hypothetical protein
MPDLRSTHPDVGHAESKPSFLRRKVARAVSSFSGVISLTRSRKLWFHFLGLAFSRVAIVEFFTSNHRKSIDARAVTPAEAWLAVSTLVTSLPCSKIPGP